MFLLESDELSNHAVNIIHKETQQHKLSLDLTVSEIHRFTQTGSLDFGGSEFKPAGTERVTAKKKNSDDDYSWWSLDEGTYLAVFNERLQYLEDTISFITPHTHTCRTGIIANSKLVTSEDYEGELNMTFRTPASGCRIKENARFANLVILAE